LQAAFVDIGSEKNGFLAFGEIHPNVSKSFKIKNTVIVLEVYISEILDNIKTRIQQKMLRTKSSN